MLKRWSQSNGKTMERIAAPMGPVSMSGMYSQKTIESASETVWIQCNVEMDRISVLVQMCHALRQ